MGGGDLNSKKSWHPNTMKNQERVWKAEQAAAEEKKRISELQRERAEERDRAELNQMAQRSANNYGDNRLNWMYDKPDKKIHEEDYLLGKSIDQNYSRADKEEQSSIPAVARRVVGSSMLASGGDAQVDLARKMREDPLLLVKERERAARAALLNNPLQRRRLTDLLRKEQVQRKEKTKKKAKKKGQDLDNMLAAKLSALSEGKGIDIAKLLDSDDSSSDSSDSSDDKHRKKRKKVKEQEKQQREVEKKKRKKSKKKQYHSSDDSDSSDDNKHKKNKSKAIQKSSDRHDHNSKIEAKKGNGNSANLVREKKFKEHSRSPDRDDGRKRVRCYSSNDNIDKNPSGDRRREETHKSKRHAERSRYTERVYEGDRKRNSSPDHGHRWKSKKGLSEEERAAKLAEMVAAGAEREEQRGKRVAEQRRADAADVGRAPRTSGHEARALPDSLEARIRSNRHYIQRDRHHMNEHFAKR
ncbi:unnamed protein product [Chilo suppressalis]|uniref:CBF1-interacting co-repressor CIR N-terminal domain-containing protein n=1 Tax=Chilo suppressalis TaxID=168631 RepID=A0ABN8B6C5_CHISP|nr:unnamed protein product [Chilo suppressalis]